MTERPRWALALHGGAGPIAPEWQEPARRGLRAALAAGRAVLEDGGGAADAVEATVRALEDDEAFNAGFGAVLNADGEVEADAAIMDGRDLALGGVAALKGARHPVSVARLLLPETPVLLVAEGARRFAAERGAELCPPDELIAPRRRAARNAAGSHDTVGAVALDARGHLAAATSTGGLSGALPGRVGDSPLPGAGLYADDTLGATVFSGHGEAIARVALAARVMRGLEEGRDPQEAMEGALAHLAARIGGEEAEAGGLVLDRAGRLGWAHRSEHFAVAHQTAGADGHVHLSKSEESA